MLKNWWSALENIGIKDNKYMENTMKDNALGKYVNVSSAKKGFVAPFQFPSSGVL